MCIIIALTHIKTSDGWVCHVLWHEKSVAYSLRVGSLSNEACERMNFGNRNGLTVGFVGAANGNTANTDSSLRCWKFLSLRLPIAHSVNWSGLCVLPSQWWSFTSTSMCKVSLRNFRSPDISSVRRSSCRAAEVCCLKMNRTETCCAAFKKISVFFTAICQAAWKLSICFPY